MVREVISMAVSKDDVTVVIPTLNEEEAIGQVIQELKQAGYRSVLVVFFIFRSDFYNCNKILWSLA